MGSRNFKNNLPLRDKSYGLERRQNLTKEELNNSSPFPVPVTYEDIDKEFKKWVENEFYMTYDGERLPTYTLFSNQRFSEYLQTWEHVDDKKNPILNFKTITRENNPQSGTINGESKNIPGERTYLMKRVEAQDKNNRTYYIDYRMKQPVAVDFKYTISLMTNRYELINEFNKIVNNHFKAIDAYLRVNGHYVSMTLLNINDESQYNIDDRQFYSQSCDVLVRGYIISEEDFEVREVPKFKFTGFEGEEKKDTYAEVEELPCAEPYNQFYYKPLTVKVSIGKCDDKIKFTMDCNFTIEKLETENVRTFNFRVNDEIIENIEGILIPEGAEVKISKVRKLNFEKCGFLNFYGVQKDVVYDTEKDEVEFVEDQTQFNEIEIISTDDSACQNS